MSDATVIALVVAIIADIAAVRRRRLRREEDRREALRLLRNIERSLIELRHDTRSLRDEVRAANRTLVLQ